MTWEMLYAKNYFVVVVVVVVISLFIYIINLKLSLKSTFKNFKISHTTINRK